MREAPSRDEQVAYHEAGHAVAAYLQGLRLVRATIEPGSGHGGLVEFEMGVSDEEVAPYRLQPMPTELRERWERYLKVGLGGGIAQRYLLVSRGFSEESVEMIAGPINDDLGIVVRRLRGHYGKEHLKTKHLGKLARKTAEMLLLPDGWKLVEAVATALLVERTIDGIRLTEILKEADR